MPITISYDLSNVADNNDRTYVRSMLERFYWRRLGGSVFRYEGVLDAQGVLQEDWLNHVVPALMFFRSFILARGIRLSRFTVDAASVAHIDQSDPLLLLGAAPQRGPAVDLNANPTNQQSREPQLRGFVDAAIAAMP
jgi:hypothetical protein